MKLTKAAASAKRFGDEFSAASFCKTSLAEMIRLAPTGTVPGLFQIGPFVRFDKVVAAGSAGCSSEPYGGMGTRRTPSQNQALGE